jgi:hypothetical protein
VSVEILGQQLPRQCHPYVESVPLDDHQLNNRDHGSFVKWMAVFAYPRTVEAWRQLAVLQAFLDNNCAHHDSLFLLDSG